MAVFDPALYNSQASGTQFRGLTWTDINSDIPTSGVKVKSVLLAPRVGFAYDLSGNGETLLRGGYGLFNFHDAQGPYSGFIDLPYGVTFTNIGGSPLLRNVPNTDPNTQPSISGAILATDNKQPRTQSWSFTVQRRLPFQMVVEAGYVGSKSDRLLNDGINNLNNVPLGAMINDPTGDPNNYRPYREFGGLPVSQHSHYQNYNALQMRSAARARVQLHGVLYVVEGARHPRRRPGIDDAAGRRHRDSAYGSSVRPGPVLNIGTATVPEPGRFGGVERPCSAAGSSPGGVDLHQRRAAAGACLDRRQLRHRRHGRQPPPSQQTFLTRSPDISAMPVLTCDPRGRPSR